MLYLVQVVVPYMKTLVVSLGGSLLFLEGQRDPLYLRQISQILKETSKKSALVVVVGGGSLARAYAEKARKKQKGEFYADREAIKATRENAKTVIRALGSSAYAKVAATFNEVSRSLKPGRIVVAGGMFEGLTTDAIAVLVAEMLGAGRVVNLSNVDGIYSGDPRKDKNATKYPELSHSALVALSSAGDQRKAGTNFVFDSVASKLAARSNVPLDFVGGRDLAGVRSALLGLHHSGTVVRD